MPPTMPDPSIRPPSNETPNLTEKSQMPKPSKTPTSTESLSTLPPQPAVMTNFGKLMAERIALKEQKLMRLRSASKPKQD
ncbi:hypothetical protein D9M71_642590 [compost metagenome]